MNNNLFLRWAGLFVIVAGSFIFMFLSEGAKANAMAWSQRFSALSAQSTAISISNHVFFNFSTSTVEGYNMPLVKPQPLFVFFLPLSRVPVPVDVVQLHSGDEVARAAISALALPEKLNYLFLPSDVNIFIISRKEAILLMEDLNREVPKEEKGVPLPLYQPLNISELRNDVCLLIELKDSFTLHFGSELSTPTTAQMANVTTISTKPSVMPLSESRMQLGSLAEAANHSCPLFEVALNVAGVHRAFPQGFILLSRFGGLGNQLWEVAAGVNAALLSGRIPILDKVRQKQGDIEHMTVDYDTSLFSNLCTITVYDGSFDFVLPLPESPFAYLPMIPPSPIDAFVVKTSGYRQNPHYLPPLPVLAALFAPPPDLASRLATSYGPLENIFAVHVRRGDYLQKRDFHGVMEMPYFEAALQRAEAKGALHPGTKLFVFGDDPAWARAQPGFSRRGATIIDNENEVASFFLLALSGAGHICSNSSFCWWAAYLGRAFADAAGKSRGFVLLPKRWVKAYTDAHVLSDGIFDVIDDTEYIFNAI